jgi:hypothetical protein
MLLGDGFVEEGLVSDAHHIRGTSETGCLSDFKNAPHLPTDMKCVWVGVENIGDATVSEPIGRFVGQVNGKESQN